jgi:enterobactin synthetase component D
MFEHRQLQLPGALQHPIFGVGVSGVPVSIKPEYPPVAIPDQLNHAAKRRIDTFVAGRICARRALTTLNLPILASAADIPMGRDRAPVWPANIVGSISHTDTDALCVVAQRQHISFLGVDVENILPEAECSPLKKSIANPHEFALLGSDHPPATAFALLFSAKEAIYKAIFPEVQRFIDFHEVTLIRANQGRLHFTAAQSLQHEWWRPVPTVHMAVGLDHVVTVCLQHSDQV